MQKWVNTRQRASTQHNSQQRSKETIKILGFFSLVKQAIQRQAECHTLHYYANPGLSWLYKHSPGLNLQVLSALILLNLLFCLDGYHCCSLWLIVVWIWAALWVCDVSEFPSRPDSETRSQPHILYEPHQVVVLTQRWAWWLQFAGQSFLFWFHVNHDQNIVIRRVGYRMLVITLWTKSGANFRPSEVVKWQAAQSPLTCPGVNTQSWNLPHHK